MAADAVPRLPTQPPTAADDPRDRGGPAQQLLIAQDLEKHFPIRGGMLSRKHGSIKAVDHVSFSVLKGETMVGAGGTTGALASTAQRTPASKSFQPFRLRLEAVRSSRKRPTRRAGATRPGIVDPASYPKTTVRVASPESVATFAAFAFGTPQLKICACVVTATVPESPAARGWDELIVSTVLWLAVVP